MRAGSHRFGGYGWLQRALGQYMCQLTVIRKIWEYLEESAPTSIFSNGAGESDTGRVGGDRTRGHDCMCRALCQLQPYPHSTMHKWTTMASAWLPAPPTIKCASSTCVRTARPTWLSSLEGMLFQVSQALSHSTQAPGPGLAGGLGASQVWWRAGVVFVRWQGLCEVHYNLWLMRTQAIIRKESTKGWVEVYTYAAEQNASGEHVYAMSCSILIVCSKLHCMGSTRDGPADPGLRCRRRHCGHRHLRLHQYAWPRVRVSPHQRSILVHHLVGERQLSVPPPSEPPRHTRHWTRC